MTRTARPHLMTRTPAILLIGLVIVMTPLARAERLAPELQTRLDAAAPDERIPVIVRFAERADLAGAKALARRDRRTRVATMLRAQSAESRRAVEALLREKGAAPVVPLWIINGLAVTAPADAIRALAQRPEVESVRLDVTLTAPPAPDVIVPAAAEWNINAIRAAELWDRGIKGQGVVVANLDTGVDVLHPDLAGRWRGGTNSWFDPFGQHATPYDKSQPVYSGHGTGTMGVMLGGDADGTTIGVAPAAQWIAAKLYDDAGYTSFGVIHQAFQWFLDPDGMPATDDAPDVVNNSWGFSDTPNECLTEFAGDILALRAADIAVVCAAGNAGPALSTSLSPGNLPGSLAVGALSQSLAIDLSSSRGPSACDRSIYPALAAPGVAIRTTDLTFGGVVPLSYQTASGTSFAAAHVSGALALLRSAFPGRPIEDLEFALMFKAADLGAASADNVYGHGLLDVVAAYQWLDYPPAGVRRRAFERYE